MANRPTTEFHDRLTALLPKMRAHAMYLARDRHAAEDLVQDVVVRALRSKSSFEEGTNFTAWVRRITLNHFISGIRQNRELTGLDEVPEVAVAAPQQDTTDIREVNVAFQRLPKDQRDAMSWVVIEERSYDEMAAQTGIAVGTLKSRCHRARLQLRSHMMGDASTPL